jgi:hypothetical protein
MNYRSVCVFGHRGGCGAGPDAALVAWSSTWFR